MQRIYRPGFRYLKCGIMLTELTEAGAAQRDLFDTRDSDRRNRLMQVVDGLNRSMGRDTVTYAGSGINRGWKAVADYKSQHFSTDLRQVITIG